MAGPDLSSGRVPLDRAAAEYTPEIDNIDRGYIHTWNVAFERRLPYDVSVDVAYVGAKGVGGYAGLDINAPPTLGGGDASRPYFAIGPHPADQLVGRAAAHQVPVAAGRAEQALHQGLHVQGRLHAEQGDERRHGRRRPRHPDAGTRRASCSATGRRRASTAGTTSSWASPTRCRGRATAATTASATAILGDWQLNGVVAAFTGTPFTVTAERHVAEHAVEHADGRSGRRLQRPRQHRQRGQVVRYRVVRPADRRPLRQHGPEPVLRSWRVDRRPVGVPLVRDGRPAPSRVPRRRATTSSTTRCSAIRARPRRPARSDRSPASGRAAARTSNGSSRSVCGSPSKRTDPRRAWRAAGISPCAPRRQAPDAPSRRSHPSPR